MTTTHQPVAPPAGRAPIDTKGRSGPRTATRTVTSAWRVEAKSRQRRLDAMAHCCENLLDACERQHAEQFLREADGWFEVNTLRSWYSGLAEEQVQVSLDQAEIALVPSQHPIEPSLVATVETSVKVRFKEHDARRVRALGLLHGTPSRAKVVEAMQLLHEGNARSRGSQRARRNNTLVASVMILIAVAGLAWVISQGIGGLSLAAPVAAGAAAEAVTANAWVVAGFGAIGGLISILPLLKRTGSAARPRAPWLLQAILKIVSGALFALVAAITVQAGVIKVIDPQTAVALTIWAIVFGYSQDAITKQLDDRLSTVTAPVVPAEAGDS